MKAIVESAQAPYWGLPVRGLEQPTLQLGPDACAVMMPAELGEKIAAAIKTEGLRGPVIRHLRTGRWTFITEGWQEGDTAPMWLFNWHAMVINNGTLPLPRADDAFRAWIHLPSNEIRPRVQDVVARIQRIGGER